MCDLTAPGNACGDALPNKEERSGLLMRTKKTLDENQQL